MLRSLYRKLAAPAMAPPLGHIRGHCCSGPPKEHQVALQMIQYAIDHARSRRSGDAYAEALMVLEQGVGSLAEGNGDAVGMMNLAMATLLHERGDSGDAQDKLRIVHDSGRCSMALRVAAYEGLVGLSLEAGEDATALKTADECLQLLRSQESGVHVSNEIVLLCKAIRGLVHLTTGDHKAAETMFCASEHQELTDLGGHSANTVLSYGEFLHVCGNLSSAKDFYERALQVSLAKVVPESSYLSAANMVSEEVLVGAACSLGQLLAHSGNFQEAEEMLTKALTNAEKHFGQNHPKVGTVLTCMAIMFRHKAKLEKSSSLLIQEGLFRKAIELLKAPSLNEEGAVRQVSRSDIVTLARGGYAEILCVQQNRKMEGENMKRWAEANWRNRRLSLAEALEFTEPFVGAVVDTRISRVV